MGVGLKMMIDFALSALAWGSSVYTGLCPVLTYTGLSGLERSLVFLHRAAPGADVYRPFRA